MRFPSRAWEVHHIPAGWQRKNFAWSCDQARTGELTWWHVDSIRHNCSRGNLCDSIWASAIVSGCFEGGSWSGLVWPQSKIRYSHSQPAPSFPIRTSQISSRIKSLSVLTGSPSSIPSILYDSYHVVAGSEAINSQQLYRFLGQFKYDKRAWEFHMFLLATQ